ncbi:MAG: endo alpha-1,4 polygalactosaminidase [Proteobacteria bacterium]|nr:endo alpha-1,4 polygalactosaminidase [Pseudomonadota bacterium]
MRFELGFVVVVGGLGVGGCQPEAVSPDARQRDAAIDAAPPPWWTPAPGEVDDWDIQLAAPFDLTPTRTAYIVNLWDMVPAETTLDYGDGAPIVVPAGSQKSRLQAMHAQRPRTTVICRIDTGALALDDPDASKFPGFAANPPDDPAAPEVGSVIGWSASLPARVRWLDVRASARATVLPLIAKRFELADRIGCDAILADHNDMFAIKRTGGGGAFGDGTGFSPPLGFQAELEWYLALAPTAHALELSIGFRGTSSLTSDDLVQNYDWALADSCGEHQDCDTWSPFQRSAFGAKAVLALDYDRIVDGRGPGQFCIAQRDNNLTDGIIKDEALSSAHWEACPNPTGTSTDAGP